MVEPQFTLRQRIVAMVMYGPLLAVLFVRDLLVAFLMHVMPYIVVGLMIGAAVLIIMEQL